MTTTLRVMRGAGETVGTNVRRYREARGMSLAELGRVSRLSKGTLTQLEAGLANPTVDTLHALSRALGTTLGDLVSDPPTVGPQVVRAGEGPRLQSWDGGARLVQRTLLGNAIVETYDIQLGADGVHRSPAHAAGVVEHLFVTGGRMAAGPDADPTSLALGDSIRFDADQPHRYEPLDGPASALLTMFFPAVARIGDV